MQKKGEMYAKHQAEEYNFNARCKIKGSGHYW